MAAPESISAQDLTTFEDVTPWKVVVSDDVTAHISSVALVSTAGAAARAALHLDFNFNGKAGWAMAQRQLAIAYPENFEIVLRLRGDAKPNDLQFKLIDASGDNVWWYRRTDYVVPKSWDTLRISKRDIEFAWGPSTDQRLQRSATVEIGFAAGHGGGAGALEIASIALNELPAQAAPAHTPSANETLSALAQHHARGAFPRAWLGEQTYWTIVGIDGGAEEGMLSEDGAFELRKSAPSLEPFLNVDGVSYDWASVTMSQSLRDRYLPMPNVRWSMPGGTLDTEAFGAGERGADYAVVRYEYANTTLREQAVTLAIAVRPMQVNPQTQFLNGSGGAAPIRELSWDGRMLSVNGSTRILPLSPPELFTASSHAQAPTPELLLSNPTASSHLVDDSAFASGAFIYRRKVPAGATVSFAMLVPWSIDAAHLQGMVSQHDAASWLAGSIQRSAASWHQMLDQVTLTGPPALQPMFDTLHTALAHILINRDGPGLQPGSRSYERSWIRDGALSSASLLRLGHAPIAREFMDWYSQYLFSNGKVPCCVDFRGADPVPENDSPGEFIWLASELERYTHDPAVLRRLWPRISAAMAYLESLRLSGRTPANAGKSIYGLLPASISHEGYSAKPMHSYWDDFWAVAGYDGAVYIAGTLGEKESLHRWQAARKQFRADLHASLLAAMQEHHIDFIPGCAELGDFDATSTTIALSPIDAGALLPEPQLRNTFERYWQDFSARREDWAHSAARGGNAAAPSKWPVYTPYELRTIGSFIRLGWQSRAVELLDFFMLDRRPAAWNQWAEVVGRELRAPRFIGDMPHGWVASDYIRSVLDMFAYERADGALVLAAGIDPRWLEGDGIAIRGLRTQWGPLSYTLRRDARGKPQLDIESAIAPPGGVILALGGSHRRIKGR